MIQTRDLDLPHGIRLRCHQAGEPGAPRVLMLHGFPEAGFIWAPLQRALAHRAQLWAPDLRGFGASTAPREVAAYRVRHLMADVQAVVAAMGGPLDLLIAHDWGGAVAWNLTAQCPNLVQRLMIINSPHPQKFLEALRHDPTQQAASAYMNELCQADAAQRLTADDHQRLWAFFEGEGQAGADWLTPAVKAQYREVWATGLEGALNWYRASPLRPPQSAADPLWQVVFPPEAVTVHQPTRVIWGEADVALPSALVDGLQAWVPQLSLRRVPGASHWIVHEQPELILSEVVAQLDLMAAQ